MWRRRCSRRKMAKKMAKISSLTKKPILAIYWIFKLKNQRDTLKISKIFLFHKFQGITRKLEKIVGGTPLRYFLGSIFISKPLPTPPPLTPARMRNLSPLRAYRPTRRSAVLRDFWSRQNFRKYMDGKGKGWAISWAWWNTQCQCQMSLDVPLKAKVIFVSKNIVEN